MTVQRLNCPCVIRNSSNSSLDYPCAGIIEDAEFGIGGQLIWASFRVNGQGCPVIVRDLEFEFDVDPEPTEAEKAEALGFDSVARMREHQEWLDRMSLHREQVRSAVNCANAMGSPIYIVPQWRA